MHFKNRGRKRQRWGGSGENGGVEGCRREGSEGRKEGHWNHQRKQKELWADDEYIKNTIKQNYIQLDHKF